MRELVVRQFSLDLWGKQHYCIWYSLGCSLVQIEERLGGHLPIKCVKRRPRAEWLLTDQLSCRKHMDGQLSLDTVFSPAPNSPIDFDKATAITLLSKGHVWELSNYRLDLVMSLGTPTVE